MTNSATVVIASAVAAGLIAIGFIFNVISVATDYWVSASVSGIGSNVGLWRSCADGFGCVTVSVPDSPDWLNAARALTILAGLLALVVTAPLVVVATVLQKPAASVAAIVVALLPPLFLAAGILVWVGGVEIDLRPAAGPFVPITYDWSFALGWVGVGFYFFGAVTLGVQSIFIRQQSGMV